MVVIGGITRLTESGLSITQWQLVSGVLPPLTDAQWAAEFARYKAIPQYRAIHPMMHLADFKFIFFWEYLHRLWGRLIGAAYALPLLWFLWRRQIPLTLVPRLAGLFVLVGLQGVLGWYMVESGLSQRIEVSQYRLAAHLAAAIIIYAATLWTALDLLAPASGHTRPRLMRGLLLAALGLVFLTLVAGAFVAGTRAGYIDNSFPLMEGRFVPPDYWQRAPWYRNIFETLPAVQFDHRLLAEATWASIIGVWIFSWRLPLARQSRLALSALAAMATLQAGLGIATLLLVVPLPLAALHQAGAVFLVTAVLVALHALEPAPKRAPSHGP
jgi:cytochrome c oxidase assembly protein subunit 15